MIQLQNFGKQYGDFTAVKNVTFDVKKGEIFGFLGPNGAGKTTTIKMLMGILVPSEGEAKINGKDCQNDRVDVKKDVGYLPDTPTFYDYLKGHEIVRFVAEMHGQSSADAKKNAEFYLNELGLSEATQEFAVNYSLGMKKKLGLACAMVHKPKVLILDEPTNGLDPRASRDVQAHLKKFVAEGGTVLLSTHLMDMAQKLCNRVAVIHNGAIVALGTVDEIQGQLKDSGSLEELFLKLTEDDGTHTP